MAGFREFVAGEVLTAANVDDFLAKQVVQKYADAAARDAALGTAVAGGNALREGMVAYLDSTDEVIKYDGSAWTTIGNAGIGSNVVSNTLTSAFSTTSTSYVDVTGFLVTITPTSATSKVLLMFSTDYSNPSDTAFNQIQIQRDGTTAVGATDLMINIYSNTANSAFHYSCVLLDAPATTSAVTYQVRALVTAGTFRFNARRDGSAPRVASLVAIEVKA